MLLSAALSRAGHEVTCLKGEGAVSRVDAGGARVVEFSTNADLLGRLRELGASGAGAVFHAAALCDYRVKSVRDGDGVILKAEKLPTRTGELIMNLEPTMKLLPELRGIFPAARLVGWKYELDGTPGDVIAKGRGQLTDCRTDACVVNGAAWGSGFGFIEPGREPVRIADKISLCTFLADWLGAGK